MLIDVGGYRLRAELLGQGQECLVLLHGLASHLGTWRKVGPALAARRRVLLFDQRGHGGSDNPPAPWSLDDLSGEVACLLDALSIPRTHVLGHSGGGVIAMHFALRFPERVDRLVLVATASQANERAAAWYQELAGKADAEGGRAILADLRSKEAEGAPDSPGAAAYARCMSTLHAAPLTHRLAELRAPLTILVGTEDFIGAGGSVLMHRAVPGSRLRILEGMGHEIHLEDPERFVQLIEEALAPLSEGARSQPKISGQHGTGSGDP